MNKLTTLLEEEWSVFELSFKDLTLSKSRVELLVNHTYLDFEQREKIDAYTAKLSRTSDIYTHKILRTIWGILKEPFLPQIDFYNKCEKLEIIVSSDELFEIRDVRNRIAHEYLIEDIATKLPYWIEIYHLLEKNKSYTQSYIANRLASE